jgi:flagellar protein FliS
MAIGNPYNAFNQYKQNNILQAPPEELTWMLYNGVIKFVHQAMVFIDEKNIPKAHETIVRASDIVTELNITLDMQYDVSKRLRSIYDFLLDRLVQANIQKDKKILEEILPFLTEMRDTWKEAMSLAKKK